MDRVAELVLVVGASLFCFAKDKPVYTEHGSVIAMRTERVVHNPPAHADPYGNTAGGLVGSHKVPVFTISTAMIDYEIEGRPLLAIDQEVDVRIINQVLRSAPGGLS